MILHRQSLCTVWVHRTSACITLQASTLKTISLVCRTLRAYGQASRSCAHSTAASGQILQTRPLLKDRPTAYAAMLCRIYPTCRLASWPGATCHDCLNLLDCAWHVVHGLGTCMSGCLKSCLATAVQCARLPQHRACAADDNHSCTPVGLQVSV